MKDRHQAASYPLRLPDDLKRAIEESAAIEGRSLNAEIARRLEASFEVRLPEPILQRVREAARQNNRPVATELLHRVIDTFALEERRADAGRPPSGEWEKRLDRLMLQVDALHKWMKRQPEDKFMEADTNADPVVIGQVREPVAPRLEIKDLKMPTEPAKVHGATHEHSGPRAAKKKGAR